MPNYDYYNKYAHTYVCTQYHLRIFDWSLLEKITNSRGIILTVWMMGTRDSDSKKYSQVGRIWVELSHPINSAFQNTFKVPQSLTLIFIYSLILSPSPFPIHSNHCQHLILSSWKSHSFSFYFLKLSRWEDPASTWHLFLPSRASSFPLHHLARAFILAFTTLLIPVSPCTLQGFWGRDQAFLISGFPIYKNHLKCRRYSTIFLAFFCWSYNSCIRFWHLSRRENHSKYQTSEDRDSNLYFCISSAHRAWSTKQTPGGRLCCWYW